jgi:hypothetical protein
MGSAVNSGAYFCPGADVLIADAAGDWLGRILAIGVKPDTQPIVAVLDPQSNTGRFVGQKVVCTLQDLRSATLQGKREPK